MPTIRQLLRESATERIPDSATCEAWIADVNEAYRSLRRPGMSGFEIVSIKLETIFWRSRLLRRLLADPPEWARASPETTLKILTAINTRLGSGQRPLAAALLNPPRLARLLAHQGVASEGFPELAEQAGPSVRLKIIPNRRSSVTYEKWRGDPRLSRYRYEGEGVRYRGIWFRPGDVLLANVNLDGNGVYTSFSKPRGFSSHSGFFAMLEHGGLLFPVVVETYEKGVRPVPLSVFLGARYCSYVEVYRHRDYAAGHAPAINRAAAEYVESVRGYNFDCEDPDPTYMACTSVGRFMLAAAGLEPPRRFSRLDHPRVERNLERIDYPYLDYFGPVDFLLNDCFDHVGFVDNNHIEHLLARELIDREVLRRIETYEIDPDRFPFPYRINRWALGRMRRRTLLGRAFSALQGFPAENLPRGPDKILAAILPVEKQMGKAIVRTRPTVVEVLTGYEHLDSEAFFADPRIRAAVQKNTVLPWLEREPSPVSVARPEVSRQSD